MKSIFHSQENCKGQIKILKKSEGSPYEFKCYECKKGVSVMHTDGLSEEDNKIFEELMKNDIL